MNLCNNVYHSSFVYIIKLSLHFFAVDRSRFANLNDMILISLWCDSNDFEGKRPGTGLL